MFSSSERCPAQLVPAQVLHEGGEREGRRLDGGRQRVLPQEAGEGDLGLGFGLADVDAANAVVD